MQKTVRKTQTVNERRKPKKKIIDLQSNLSKVPVYYDLFLKSFHNENGHDAQNLKNKIYNTAKID